MHHLGTTVTHFIVRVSHRKCTYACITERVNWFEQETVYIKWGFRRGRYSHHIFSCKSQLKTFSNKVISDNLIQGCTNPGRRFAMTTVFYTGAPNIVGSSVYILLHVTFLTPRIFRCFPDFCKICASLVILNLNTDTH